MGTKQRDIEGERYGGKEIDKEGERERTTERRERYRDRERAIERENKREGWQGTGEKDKVRQQWRGSNTGGEIETTRETERGNKRDRNRKRAMEIYIEREERVRTDVLTFRLRWHLTRIG